MSDLTFQTHIHDLFKQYFMFLEFADCRYIFDFIYIILSNKIRCQCSFRNILRCYDSFRVEYQVKSVILFAFFIIIHAGIRINCKLICIFFTKKSAHSSQIQLIIIYHCYFIFHVCFVLSYLYLAAAGLLLTFFFLKITIPIPAIITAAAVAIVAAIALLSFV